MKIELVKLKFNDTHSYKYKPFKYCCETMQNNKSIVFTDEDLMFDDKSELVGINHGDDVIPQFCTSHIETFDSYGDEFEFTYNYPIKFCPHCGKKIEIKVVDEIDVSEEYQELSQRRKELADRHQKTDSKKDCLELIKQIQDIYSKINYFYYFDEWNGE